MAMCPAQMLDGRLSQNSHKQGTAITWTERLQKHAQLEPGDKQIKTVTDRPRTLLQQLARNPDKLFKKPFARQYGALCFRYRPDSSDIEILVVTSRETRRWIIPKGWPMKGKLPHKAAAVEALEEAGVRGKARKTSVGSYVYLKDLDNGDVRPCIVDVYQIEVREVISDFKERAQRIREWVSADEAARRVREIQLKSLLINFNPRLRTVRR